jgi:hypothetical protein
MSERRPASAAHYLQNSCPVCWHARSDALLTKLTLPTNRRTNMLPSTVERVPAHTEETINERIRRQTEENVERFRNSSPEAIARRLEELDREWVIERTLEANAATACLAGLTLGATVDRRWYFFPAVVAGFLLQHALQGWCPPLPIFRRLGIRTPYEIDYERHALKGLRGDFDHLQDETAAAPQSALQAAEK